MAGLPPARHGVGTVFVQGQCVAIVTLAQVVTDVVRVRFFARGDGAAFDLGLLDEYDRETFADHVARRHRDAAHDAAVRGGDHVFHLHRFDDRDLLPLPYRVPDDNADVDDGEIGRAHV